MADMSLDTDGGATGHRRGDARTLEEHVDQWAARRMRAGVPARRCVLPFLTGAPKAVECRLCSRIIYAGEEIRCSVSRCQEMFHLNCVVKDTSKFTTESFRCPQHGCVICKQKMFFWRCGRCAVAAHTKCAPWPVIRLKDDRGSAICWRHPSDWLLQNENAESTSSIEEVFCRLPLPYVNKNFSDPTIIDFADAVYKPPPYTAIKRNIYLIKKKRTGVRVDTGCTDCRAAHSTCKENCECRALSLSCSKNCRCSDLCTNKPFRKDKKIKIVKTHQRGWGVVALEPVEKGEFIVEYVGEVIDDTTCEQRLQDLEKRGDKSFYMCEISKDFTIDATFKGNVSRFLNHSCEPNCKLEKWQVSGETRVGFFASRAIKIGEPLTYECRPVRRRKDKVPKCLFLEHQHLPPSHPLDPMCEAIATRHPHNASIGARAQHVASIDEEQNILNPTQIMVDFGRPGLDHELEQDFHDESLNVPANDSDQQAERNDECAKRPLTRSKRGISKEQKVIAVTLTPCVEETGSIHSEFRSVQANVNASLDVSANDGDQQGQISDEHITERPLSASKGGIFKKHKAIAEMPCIEDTGSVHAESGSALS